MACSQYMGSSPLSLWWPGQLNRKSDCFQGGYEHCFVAGPSQVTAWPFTRVLGESEGGMEEGMEGGGGKEGGKEGGGGKERGKEGGRREILGIKEQLQDKVQIWSHANFAPFNNGVMKTSKSTISMIPCSLAISSPSTGYPVKAAHQHYQPVSSSGL